MLCGEIQAFIDGFDASFILLHDLQAMTGTLIPITILNDSESPFKVIFNSSITTEKRLMVDIRDTREAYERDDISDVGLVRSAKTLADDLTKFSKAQELL